MRLINTSTLELEQYYERNVPKYAILSHTWGNEELSLQDMQQINPHVENLAGFKKVKACCQLALAEGYRYIWIDTCSIDKSSSSELSEAINSMFRWYGRADICYVYLADVRSTFSPTSAVAPKEFAESRWFTRGWTLQELIAPSKVNFYTQDWTKIASRLELRHILRDITGIDERAFGGSVARLSEFSIAQRLYWASNRNTTRIEDMAYCLLGLFDVNMPLLYGEGPKAFTRLQEEIIKDSDDESIFAWRVRSGPIAFIGRTGLLASSPADFADSEDIVPTHEPTSGSPWSMTNKGLCVTLQLQRWTTQKRFWRPQPAVRIPDYLHTSGEFKERDSLRMAALNCRSLRDKTSTGKGTKRHPVIWLKRVSKDGQYTRLFPEHWVPDDIAMYQAGKGSCETIYVTKRKFS
ncbi:MAG: hypothetical protein Q9160_006747 [Pyrenula sp. 1 TL-2023]